MILLLLLAKWTCFIQILNKTLFSSSTLIPLKTSFLHSFTLPSPSPWIPASPELPSCLRPQHWRNRPSPPSPDKKQCLILLQAHHFFTRENLCDLLIHMIPPTLPPTPPPPLPPPHQIYISWHSSLSSAAGIADAILNKINCIILYYCLYHFSSTEVRGDHAVFLPLLTSNIYASATKWYTHSVN